MKKTIFAVAACIALLFTFAGAALASQDSGDAARDILHNLKFRNIGPAIAGGRVSSVVGVPGHPNTFYVGAGGGGVWKTTDGGNHWQAIFKGQPTSSVGTVALAPSNPNLVWVGTGEPNIRNDVLDGKGVFFSPDGGKTWEDMGLDDAGQIGGIVIDPNNPDIVMVAALGHIWGRNKERGVFRTTDGGKTWHKVLYVNDHTGAIDIDMEPGNPKVLFAAMWQVVRLPWELKSGGPGSGIYRSTDGGQTWHKLTKGLPKSPLGRIEIAIAPSNPDHVYALIGAKKGLLWESTDMGDSWHQVSDNHALDVRPFYFSVMQVAPHDENKVFFAGFRLVESDDGGKTAHVIDRHVHVDHHALWIDPTNPKFMLQGNDGGAYVSHDGGKSWRYLNNIPIGQFYQVAADSKFPYNLCGGLQDNNGWCGPSSNLNHGAVTGIDWFSVVGGDGQYVVPAPSDPNIIYGDSQNGFIVRLNKKTGLKQYVRPYLPGVSDLPPSQLKYRFNWTSPIAVSPTDPNTVYLGGNVLFKSSDGGKRWQVISPDLTRNDKSKQVSSGGIVMKDISGAETYDTILSITLAPHHPNVIWVGTDDGLVQVSRDGGQHWNEVSPPGAPEWARISQIGVSPFDPGTAYVAVDGHKLDNRNVYVYRTTNYGRSWDKIIDGLPPHTPAHVVREDPNRKGFLVLGTGTGLYYSRDAGDHWQPLTGNFPTAPVYDLKFIGKPDALAVATHGRGLFVLDDLRPLEGLSNNVKNSDFALLPPAPGVLAHSSYGGDVLGPPRYEVDNAPMGVVISYYLKSKIKQDKNKKGHKGPVKIVITDAQGNKIATEHAPGDAGINEYEWSMDYAAATQLDFEKHEGNRQPHGPRVLAGTYHVALTANGKTLHETVHVHPDPRFNIPRSNFEQQLQAALTVRNEVSALDEMLNRVVAMHKSLNDFEQQAGNDDDHHYDALTKQAKALDEKLVKLEESVYNTKEQHNVPEDDIHYLSSFRSNLRGLYFNIRYAYGTPPNDLLRNEMHRLHSELVNHLADFNQLLKTDVQQYNKAAYQAGAPTVMEGQPIQIKQARM
ncbi:MAG TPA: hypothetical protein VFK24_01660 [Gammaproteobacteria bacterium]|nr:hypothetical protein [Gammaproteobacteria bacterium]